MVRCAGRRCARARATWTSQDGVVRCAGRRDGGGRGIAAAGVRRPAGQRLRRRRLPVRRRRRVTGAPARRCWPPASPPSSRRSSPRPRPTSWPRCARCPIDGLRARASSAPISRARSSRRCACGAHDAGEPAGARPGAAAAAAGGGTGDRDDARARGARRPGARRRARSRRGVTVSCGHTDATAAQAHLPPSTAARARSRTCSTPCARARRATPGSRWPRSRAPTSPCR